MRYEREEIVEECYFECEFFDTDSNGMVCTHPYFKDKDVYDGMIIDQDNSRDGNIPEKCPLRCGETEVVLKIKLNARMATKEDVIQAVKKQVESLEYTVTKTDIVAADICQCGCERRYHGKSHSINFTEGKCSICKCKNFVIKN